MPSIASKQLKAGEVVFECKPLFVCVKEQFRGKYCDNCLKKSNLLKRCAKCLEMYYCDKNCQTIDWKFHKNECKIYAKFSIGSFDYRSVDVQRLLLRFWLSFKNDPNFGAQRHQLMDGSDICLNDIKLNDKKLRQFLKTEAVDRFLFETICSDFRAYGLKFDRKELLHWYGVMEMPFVYPIKYFTDNPFLLFESSHLPIAYGVYPQISNVSHSCLPNCGFVATNGISIFN